MAHRDAATRDTFLVELCRPGLDVDVLKQWAARVREAAAALEREGRQVRHVRAAAARTNECGLVPEAAGRRE